MFAYCSNVIIWYIERNKLILIQDKFDERTFNPIARVLFVQKDS